MDITLIAWNNFSCVLSDRDKGSNANCIYNLYMYGRQEPQVVMQLGRDTICNIIKNFLSLSVECMSLFVS